MSELTSDEMRRRIDASVPCEEYTRDRVTYDEGAYENAARYACKLLLAAASRDPVRFREAMDAYRANPFDDGLEQCLVPGERDRVMKGEYGLTGFQWGWACQTAAWLTEQAPVGNPAIWTVRA